MLYFDTSAVLPYYREEAASRPVQQMLQASTRPVLVSHLTRVEVASALARWVRMGELSEAQANRIESPFLEDLRAGRFVRVSLDPEVFERACHWLLTRRSSLRTLDALHLAAAEICGAELVTLDRPLVQAARLFGVTVRCPGEDPAEPGQLD
ncbi:type II toxin-antitoxin system VapC family toxin [Thioalkalivibrio sp. ALR17-21]|uniref:type II toxin-antitoxin system VapC family toxin n=1 Tax=Thioalkalivibrio sp. ALR17-21 TaxID=1269813 RepID=UPI0003F6D0BC|nr:type II toxin-antitoxin system VapC family toxin [Thioalkalivibrio sp. ALR17-21]